MHAFLVNGTQKCLTYMLFFLKLLLYFSNLSSSCKCSCGPSWFLPILLLLSPSPKIRSQGICYAWKKICVLSSLSLSLVTARAQMSIDGWIREGKIYASRQHCLISGAASSFLFLNVKCGIWMLFGPNKTKYLLIQFK